MFVVVDDLTYNICEIAWVLTYITVLTHEVIHIINRYEVL